MLKISVLTKQGVYKTLKIIIITPTPTQRFSHQLVYNSLTFVSLPRIQAHFLDVLIYSRITLVDGGGSRSCHVAPHAARALCRFSSAARRAFRAGATSTAAAHGLRVGAALPVRAAGESLTNKPTVDTGLLVPYGACSSNGVYYS